MSRLDTRRFKILSLIGKRPGVAFEPLEDIGWLHAWWAAGPESRALGLADEEEPALFPDEIGTADMTPDDNGPTYLVSSSALGGRAAFTTDGLTVLRTDAAAITVTRPYSIFWLGRTTVTTDPAVYVGGQTAVSVIAPMAAVGAAGGCMNLYGGFDSGSGAIATTKRVWTSVCVTGAGDKNRVGGTTSTKNTGDSIITRIALGGYADTPGIATETHFLGVYQGDLTLHPRFADLEAWAAAS